MFDLFKIILTACITVLVGVLVFSVGQIILKFFIEPIQDQKRLIGDILSTIFHYYVISMTAEVHINPTIKNEAKEKILFLAKDLFGKTQLIPYYNMLEKLKIVVSFNNIEKISKDLYGLVDEFTKEFPDEKNVGNAVRNITSALKVNNKKPT